MLIKWECFLLPLIVSDENENVKAEYTWLADGTKVQVAGNNGRGYVYLGSLVYSKDGDELAFESAGLGGGRIIASEGTSGTVYEPLYHYASATLTNIR